MSTKTWVLIALSMILFFTVFNWAQACEGDKGHAYIGLGIGKAGTWMNGDPQEKDKWDDDGGNHAIYRGGYRHPVFQNWLWAGFEAGHHSTYDKSPPEPELDYWMVNVEVRLIP